MFRPFILFIAAVAAPAIAAPDANQAEKFRRDLRQLIDQGAVNVSTMQLRTAHQAKLQELEKRAGRLFGGVHEAKFGSCVRAASAMSDTWTDLMMRTGRVVDGRDLALLSKASFDAGIEYLACREAIDALAPAVPQDCMVTVDVANPNAKVPQRPAHCPKL